jgi:hypothetical protein
LNENKLSVLPDEKDRLFDVELGVLMLNGSLTYKYKNISRALLTSALADL